MDRFPDLDLPGRDLPPEVLALVPAPLARAEDILPLALDGYVLTLAVARPADLEFLDRLAFACRLRIAPVAVRPEGLRAAVARHYGPAVDDA